MLNSQQCQSFIITAYSIEQYPNTTASGISTQGQAGVIAAEGRPQAHHFAFGTVIEIDGVGTYRIEDRGSGLIGNHVDVLFQTTREALNFGRQTRMVCVVS
jgi:3D (Asp-Asp-Asp) domain-containing protein